MLDRRKFLKWTAAGTAGAHLAPTGMAVAKDESALKDGGEGYSQFSGAQLTAVPSICSQCPSHCAIIGYLDSGRVVKIEGQPNSIRNQGRVCAKGQAGAAIIYDPDRILYPLRRAGRRGEGKWQRISWEEALDDLAGRLMKLREENTPERFVFHHGWIPASAERLINDVFLASYGTASIIGQTCEGQSARRTAQLLTWGASRDSWDFDKTRLVLNFGSNVLEADANHVALARRLVQATANKRVKLVTFDVRLSNTAAKSDLWVPVKPGTDLAVVLAMCHVIMIEDLYRGAGEDFLEFCLVSADRQATGAEKVAALKAHLEQYTPKWAEEISGVNAEVIAGLAREFAVTRPACVISSRGASARYNGVETERAIQMLAAITGTIDTPGGRCQAVAPEWVTPTGPDDKPARRRLAVIDAQDDAAMVSGFSAGHNVLKAIKDGGERPGVYMWYHHNPAFSNADTREVNGILKDETLLPFTVAVTPYYDETADLADLILPDATFLERFDFEEGVSPGQVAEYALCQPLAEPQGEARDFKDVCCELAEKMGFPLGFKSGEKFVETACRLTPAVKTKARGFRGLKEKGVWHDGAAAPAYAAYRRPVSAEDLAADGVIRDEASGVYWNWKTAGLASEVEAAAGGYRRTPSAWKGYVGQEIGGSVYAGFRPGKLNKSGYFELYSPVLAARGLAGLPSYVAIPEHEQLGDGQLVLTTFKVNVQALSTTGNGPWLSEISHDNPLWINPATAAARGVADGDAVEVASPVGRLTTVARVTPTIAPGVVALASHTGRWAGGRYASGKPAPFGIDDARHDKYVWWQERGENVNQIIAGDVEPVSGQQRWMDTVVTVTRAQ